MFELHWHHPFMGERNGRSKASDARRAENQFPDPPGTVTTFVTASGRGSNHQVADRIPDSRN